MVKKNKSEKFVRGKLSLIRTIKLDFCPKCQKTGINIEGALGLAGIGILVKKNGNKIIRCH